MWLLLAIGLFLGLTGWAAYQFLIRPAQTLVEGFRQVIALEAGVRADPSFTPPADGRLSPGQLERFLAVQREVKQGLGPRYPQLEARLEQLARQYAGQTTLDYRAVLDLFRGTGALLPEAKRLQVEALRAQGFSREEYAWVRQQVYAALGYGLPQLDLEAILRQIAVRDFNPRVALLRAEASEVNLERVAPFGAELLRYYPFTWFGL